MSFLKNCPHRRHGFLSPASTQVFAGEPYRGGYGQHPVIDPVTICASRVLQFSKRQIGGHNQRLLADAPPIHHLKDRFQAEGGAAFHAQIVQDQQRRVAQPAEIFLPAVKAAAYHVRQHQDNAAIAKLRSNVPLTEADVRALEAILWSEIGTKQEYEAEYGEKPLGEFVREIVGLDMAAAKAAFAEYLSDVSLDSRQIYFVNQIVEYIVHNGLMKDLSVLQEPPFTDRGSIVEIFTDLTLWARIKKAIDRFNANAVAA